MGGLLDGEAVTAGFARYDSGYIVPLCEDHTVAARRITETMTLEEGKDEFPVQLVMEE